MPTLKPIRKKDKKDKKGPSKLAFFVSSKTKKILTFMFVWKGIYIGNQITFYFLFF